MKKLLLSAALAGIATPAFSQALINELYFNPAGTDSPNEFVELRGTPGAALTGLYLLGLEGDATGAGGGPGVIQNIFDLTSRSFGANGFLFIGQKTSPYTADSSSTAIFNSGSGAGFGNGATSSIGHSGEIGTDIENASATYLLVNIGSGAAPVLLNDLDANNDGTLELPAGWTILDGVGVLDNTTTAGDLAYGLINYANNTGAGTGPNLQSVAFTAGYLARQESSTGSTPSDWLAADTTGSAGNFNISTTATSDPEYAGQPINSFGSVNPAPIPEPTTYALLGLGLGALLWKRRSARK